MAQHNDLNDRELAGWLESLTPRRSAVDRERVLYEAGRAAAVAEQRRWRTMSLAATASGWLAAAALLGMSWSRSDPLVASGSDAKQSVPAAVNPAIEPPVTVTSADSLVEGRRDVGDVSANPSVPRPGASSEPRVAEFSPRLFGEGTLTTADLRRVSRTGRLSSDRTAGTSAAGNARQPEESPRTYFEMRRAISSGEDVL